ncbi:hypothetical protein FA95DRAFT_1450423, partial [Auriscalpium vulgare]
DAVDRDIKAQQADERIVRVREWHNTLQRPDGLADQEYATFLRYCTEFFLDGTSLFRKEPQGRHQLVLPPERRIGALKACHDDVGHRGAYPTKMFLLERFWWPYMDRDVAWFV